MLLALSAALLLSLQALARQPYDAKAFEQAQAANKTVLIHVHASWCPVCKKQEPILGQLEKEKPNLLVYVVDFDGDKSVLKKFGVTSQATLILFKGAKEVGRSMGDTDASRIAALVNKGF
jgi:thiol-disulfide isomerase/thioredoxin